MFFGGTLANHLRNDKSRSGGIRNARQYTHYTLETRAAPFMKMPRRFISSSDTVFEYSYADDVVIYVNDVVGGWRTLP